MLRRAALVMLTLGIAASPAVRGDKADVARVRKSVAQSTLNQPESHPFHLKASFAARRQTDQSAKFAGEIEFWWMSPTKYRREVRTPEFHQIDIVDGEREWQKNEGDYFPGWLRTLSNALIEPVPNLDNVLKMVDESDVKKLFGLTAYSWMESSTNGEISGTMGAALEITDKTGLIQNGSGFGWSGDFQNYRDFHGHPIARTVSSGSPEIVANVTTLEDLGDVPGDLFDASANGGDPALLRTVLLDEMTARKNLLPAPPVEWPALPDGPTEGAFITDVMIDRTGTVREVGTVVSNNPGINEAATRYISSLRFQPNLANGEPVQVFTRITMAFKSSRPAGVETFDSARDYFERGRGAGFLAAAQHQSPYVLHATFQARTSDGNLGTGTYTDTWMSDTQWRREASIGKSSVVRTRHGDKYYRSAEGPDAGILNIMMKAIEPIPAIDTFVESDWKIKRDPVDGVNAIRVLTGYVNPAGEFDAEHVRAFWFDENGEMRKAYIVGIEVRRSRFQQYEGTAVARHIELLHGGGLAMPIDVTEISATAGAPDSFFELKGHEWKRQFTDEVR